MGTSVAEKIAVRLAERGRDRVSAILDRARSTRRKPGPRADRFSPVFSLAASDIRLAADDVKALAETTAHYLLHRFDILGSGWVQVGYGRAFRGLMGIAYPPRDAPKVDGAGDWLTSRVTAANLPTSRALWQALDGDYVPIDWQVDVRSGYRWDERHWFKRLPPAPPGADIKVPWELGRMQHLPQLAVAARLAANGEPGFAAPEVYRREFSNEIRDFLATNPPRFGVQWASPMEVAIRAVNWLVAYDLFVSEAPLEDALCDSFRRAVWQHGDHVAHHLENDRWSVRNNHYLANLVGLLVIAAHFPADRDSENWWRFARDEMLEETLRQFHRDGGNFEGSVAYHGFSAEMVALGLATILAKDPNAVGTPHLERLEAISSFSAALTKPSGAFAQIGDNDSGKLLKLLPKWHRSSTAAMVSRFANLDPDDELSEHADYWWEKPLDQEAAIEMLQAVLDPTRPPATAGAAAALVRRLAATAVGRKPPTGEKELAVTPAPDGLLSEWERFPEGRVVRRYSLAAGATAAAERLAFPDFGLYLYRSPRLFLAIRCGSIGQAGVGGHDHFDQLAIELWADGRDVAVDPGTGVYTPLPALRNAYRSVSAHAAPQWDGREPGRLDQGAFRLGGAAAGTCLYFAADGFVGAHRGFGPEVRRAVLLHPDGVVTVDYGREGGLPARAANPTPRPAFSPGYGWIERDSGEHESS